MTEELRRLAAAIPIPLEDGRLARAQVVTTPAGWSAAFGLDGGRRPEPFGPTYPPGRAGLRAAIALCQAVNGRRDR